MSIDVYEAANKLALKAYRSAMNTGKYPYLGALDDILPYEKTAGERYVGVLEIPLDLVVGTKTAGRRDCFANNFMPLLSVNSEFANKWSDLYEVQLEEGIRDPIVVYEYLRRFYVMEGNKRVSVLKSLNAVKISAKVTRILPKKTEELENRVYYEFIDFFEGTRIYEIWFSQLGSYEKLCKHYGYKLGEAWQDDDIKTLRSEYLTFRKEYKAKGGDKVRITTGDAFLAYINIFSDEDFQASGNDTIRENLSKMWDEFLTLAQGDAMKIVLEPQQVEKQIGSSIINWILDSPKQHKIAFIYEKGVGDSAWNYAHELGRMHLEQVFGSKIKTTNYEHAEYTDNSEDLLEAAIEDGNEIIFTVPAQLAKASVKAALEHPEVKILNCSTNSTYRAIRTYYCRMYETKFLLGVIAGALSQSDELGYVADYPIYSTIANINAFALGAQMVNPRAIVHLRWSSRKAEMESWPETVCIVSGKDWITPENPTRKYGLYRLLPDGNISNIAASVCHWGKFYEQIIRSIQQHTWKVADEKNKNRALNYWWGISAGVLEIVCSQKLPDGTKILIDLLTENIRRKDFNPFRFAFTKQDGTVANKMNHLLEPEEIFKMNYLVSNVRGGIPELDELKEEAREFVQLQGELK